MKRIYKFFVLISLFVFCLGSFTSATSFGDDAVKILEQLCRIQKVAFTEGEIYTADYLGRLFRDMGYDTVFEEILFPDNTILNFEQGDFLSHNIIATKPGQSDLEILIGASYDSSDVKGSTGFEGATGVSLLLEIANKIKEIELPYTVKFVLFGAGKQGNIGATHYVSTRSQEDLNKIMCFLNVTNLGSGKELYIYGNEGAKGFLRDELLEIAEENNIKLFTSPAMEEFLIPEGVGYDIGDQVPFKYSNVPYGFMEATSWESISSEFQIPDDPTGEGLGIIDGSKYNNYADIMETFEERVSENLKNASELIYKFLVREDKSIKIITSLTEENISKAGEITYTLYKDGKKIKTKKLDENSIVIFDKLENGSYKIEVSAPQEIKFLKNINEFEFNFDSNGEFVFVNDEIDTYTYREEFTDIYESTRKDISESGFNVGVKKLLFDYLVEGNGTEEDSMDKNDKMIKNLSITLGVLVVIYILLRIIFSILNKKD